MFFRGGNNNYTPCGLFLCITVSERQKYITVYYRRSPPCDYENPPFQAA
jgi:hypothetical protein